MALHLHHIPRAVAGVLAQLEIPVLAVLLVPVAPACLTRFLAQL